MSSARLDSLDELVKGCIKNRAYSAAVFAIAREGEMVRHRAFGHLDRDSSARPVRPDSLFDILSISKSVGAASSTMKLVEEEKLSLDDKVGSILRPFGTDRGRSKIRIRHLLTMSSGLPLDVPEYMERFSGKEALSAAMLTEPGVEFEPGTKVFYSDLGYRVLGMAIEKISSQRLDALASRTVLGPLGMKDTVYNPDASMRRRCPETGYSPLRKKKVIGEVVDDLDYAVGGIVGCDGLFSTAGDLTVFVQMLLNDGRVGRKQILDPKSVTLMTTDQVPHIPVQPDLPTISKTLMGMMRGMGFELKLDLRNTYFGTEFSKKTFGKIGGTGCFIAGDPETGLSAVLLTNKGLPEPLEWKFDKWFEAIKVRPFFDLANSAFSR